MKRKRGSPVQLFKKKALLSATEGRTLKRGIRISDRGQHRGGPGHGNRAKLLKILHVVQVALYLLLKVGMLAVALETKNAIFSLPVQTFLTQSM